AARRLAPWLAALAIVLTAWLPAAEPRSLPRTVFAQSSPVAPTTYYVTERSNRGIARVDVDATGHATVQTNYVIGLPSSGPDSLVFDHEGRLVVSNPDAGTLSVIDPAQRTIIRQSFNTTAVPNVADLALDPASDTVWGIEWEGTGVARVDLATGA